MDLNATGPPFIMIAYPDMDTMFSSTPPQLASQKILGCSSPVNCIPRLAFVFRYCRHRYAFFMSACVGDFIFLHSLLTVSVTSDLVTTVAYKTELTRLQ